MPRGCRGRGGEQSRLRALPHKRGNRERRKQGAEGHPKHCIMELTRGQRAKLLRGGGKLRLSRAANVLEKSAICLPCGLCIQRGEGVMVGLLCPLFNSFRIVL